LTYRAETAREVGFEPLQVGEDNRFVQACADRSLPIARLPYGFQASLVHEANTSPKLLDAEEFRPTEAFVPQLPASVALIGLFWKHKDVGRENLAALVAEAKLWRKCGIECSVIAVDNGSPEEDFGMLKSVLADCEVPYSLIRNESNLGNSAARNQALEEALECGAEYLVMVDGDITLIPRSSLAMVWELAWNPKLACLGLWSGGCSASGGWPVWRGSAGLSLSREASVAWTQYGAFRSDALAGVRFEERGPFAGPGWGWEDNDLAWQLASHGWEIACWTGAQYRHRHRGSSIRLLLEEGLDAADLWQQRRSFLLDKWAHNPAAVAQLLRAQLRLPS
jgi:cellulose synthase/poly-beta-1,6-N-acetylglucosamine synthase-like glycosyltransferase